MGFLHWLGAQIDTLIALAALGISGFALWRQRARLDVRLKFTTLAEPRPDGHVDHTFYPVVDVIGVRGTTGIQDVQLIPVSPLAPGMSGFGYSVIDIRAELGYVPATDGREVDQHDPMGMRRVITEGAIASWTLKPAADPAILAGPVRLVARVRTTSRKTIQSNEITYPPPPLPPELQTRTTDR